jgi:hypothetical protein
VASVTEDAALVSYWCPRCKRGTFALVPRRDHRITVGGQSYTVPDVALVNQCRGCGLDLITEAEWVRWQRLLGLLPA